MSLRATIHVETSCIVNDDGNHKSRALKILIVGVRWYESTLGRVKDLNLTGMLPLELVNLPYLETIEFTRTYLQGQLPPIWGTMKNLKTISLTANRLTGNIPKEWGNLSSLTYLSLEANNLSGNIPEDLGKLVNLTNLFLSSNKFVGRLPNTLMNLRNLKQLKISDNSFEGPIPEFIQNLTQLQKLELYASGLEGPIPTAIFQNLENLNDLRITDMAGEQSDFPTLNIQTFGKNNKLILRNVSLYGPLQPKILGIINAEMEMLDLSFNNLEGELPGDNIGGIKHIFLGGNKLNGSVPNRFSFNDKNDNIDLSYNNFNWSADTCTGDKLAHVNTYRSSYLKNNAV
ncbi:probable LRR receptor-like serine/threonine-protein kinase At1g29720 [Humulus lupulus]|uniref:probable LRR receptor-like serine/threonine-protein kinase At1g29720 n=1 Tax=Humulus lupulus TaxID=3486 RepID=UPI002B409D77|nr:probable LRR receptor-like serine/threonine-protein kinase At1g29720 [Humulus lupulus]